MARQKSGASSSFSLRGGLARAFVLAVDTSARAKISIHPVPSSDWFGPQSRPTISERRRPPAKPIAKIALSRRPLKSLSSVASIAQQVVGEDRFFLDGRSAMGASNAGEHGRDVPIARVQRFAELAIAPANPREAPLQRRDGNRLLSAPAVDAGGEIQPDGLRIRGQGVETLAAQPGGKLSPIGVVSALGVFGARVAGVIARLFAERREMRRGVSLRDGRGGFDSIIRR